MYEKSHDFEKLARLYAIYIARGKLAEDCVCSIESGPCERVESLQMSGRF